MAQQAALLSGGSKQLTSVNETLKKQNEATKLKRNPSVQERVRTNDSVVTILAKVYAIAKKEQEVNDVYRKEQTTLLEKSNASVIETIKATSKTIKKAIENLVKINEENLENNKTIEDEKKLFEEEKTEEQSLLEERRHKELIEALKGIGAEKKPKEKKEKEGGLLGLLGGAAMFFTKLFPGFGKLVGVIKGLFKLGEVIFKVAKFILPFAKDIIMFLVRNPAVLAALGAVAAVSKMNEITEETKKNKGKEIADKLQSIETSSKELAEKGDVEGLKKLQEQRKELGKKQSIIDVTEGTSAEKSLSTKLAKENENYVEDKLYAAAKAGSKQAQAQLDKMDEERIKKEVGTKESYESGAVYSPEGVLVSDAGMKTGEKYEDVVKGKKSEIGKAREERYKKQTESTGQSSLPVDKAKLTSTFGGRVNPVTGKYQTLHNGVDLAMPIGTPVKAMNSGVITVAGITNNVSGRTVRIKHDDGTGSGYAHLSKLSVTPGQKVNKGDVIGYSGGDPKTDPKGAGASTGPHLHLVTYDKNGNSIDPKTVIPELASAKTGNYVARAKDADSVVIKGEPTAVAEEKQTEGATGLPSLAELEDIEKDMSGLSDSAEPEKKLSIFEAMAKGIKSELDLIKQFTSGEGASELEKILGETKGMFAEMTAAPEISPATAMLTDASKTNAAMSKQSGPITVNNINQQQLAQGGGGSGTAPPPANVHDVANPSLVAALYGIHNVRTV